METTTNTRKGCLYPVNAPGTAYKKGCRCKTCKDHVSAYNKAYARAKPEKFAASGKRYRQTPTGRAKATLKNSRFDAKRGGYAPMAATWQEVRDLQQSTSTCQACGCKPDSLHTDHCHETGALRGMLCNSCNQKDALNGN